MPFVQGLAQPISCYLKLVDFVQTIHMTPWLNETSSHERDGKEEDGLNTIAHLKPTLQRTTTQKCWSHSEHVPMQQSLQLDLQPGPLNL